MTLVYICIGLFLLASPFIAIVAIVQWIRGAKTTKSDPNYKAGYDAGYRAANQRVAERVQAGGNVTLSYLAAGEHELGLPSQQQSPSEQEPAEILTDTVVPDEDATPAPESTQRATATESWSLSTLGTDFYINSLLVVGSLLFIAGGVAFLLSDLADLVKLIGSIVITVTFYGVGFALYERSTALRPAAVSFVGTGLALVPFLGVAMSSYTAMGSSAAWFLTSVIGIAAYVFAALRLNSQIVAYLAVGFALSLATSVVSLADGAVFLYFVAVIVFSLVCSIIALRFPERLPPLFAAPIVRAGDVVTPLALVASVLGFSTLSLWQYEVLFGLAMVQYVVAYLQTKNPAMETAARVLSLVLGTLIWFDVAENTGSTAVVIGMGLLINAILQQLYSFVRMYWQSAEHHEAHTLWVGAMIGLQLVSVFFWQDSTMRHELTVLSLSVILVMSVLAAYRFRRIEFAYVAAGAQAVLPIYAASQIDWNAQAEIVQLAASTLYISVAVVVLGLVDAVRSRVSQSEQLEPFLTVVFVANLALGSLYAFQGLEAIAQAVVAGASVVLVWLAAHVYRESRALLLLAIVLPWMMFSVADATALDDKYSWVFAGSMSALVAICATVVYWFIGKPQLARESMLAVSYGMLFVSVLACLALAGEPGAFGEWAVSVSLIVSAVAMAIRILVRNETMLGMTNLVAYPLFYLIALLGAMSVLGDGWQLVALAFGVGLVWASSFVERQPGLIIVANLLTIGLVWRLFTYSDLSAPWLGLAVTIVSAALFYALSWVMLQRRDDERQVCLLGSSWAMVGVGFIFWVNIEETRTAASLLLLAGAITAAIEGRRRLDSRMMEAALYIAMLALAVIISVYFPRANSLFYAYWFAAPILAAGLVWYRAQREHFIIALGIITVMAGLYALEQGGLYSLLFLTQNIAIVIAGALARRSWLVWWGLIGAVGAVFYYLRDVPFVTLMLLGVLVVGVVIWQLRQRGSKR